MLNYILSLVLSEAPALHLINTAMGLSFSSGQGVFTLNQEQIQILASPEQRTIFKSFPPLAATW